MLGKLSRIICAVLIGVIFVLAETTVHACSPSEEAMSLTLADRVENAPMILVGTVTQEFHTEYGGGYSVTSEVEVEVEQYLKGEGPAIVRIDGFGDGADCRSYIENGMRRVFFVRGNPDMTLDAVYLGVHDATWEATPETLDEITGMTNHSVEPYPLSLTQQVVRALQQHWVVVGLSALILLLCVGSGLLVTNRHRDPRKSKAKRS